MEDGVSTNRTWWKPETFQYHPQTVRNLPPTKSTVPANRPPTQHQLLNGITPHQLARIGLYHQACAGKGNIACCFTCETGVSLKGLQEQHIGDLSHIHKEGCLWQVICYDLKLFLPLHTHTPSSANLSQITAPKPNTRPEPHPTPTAPTPMNQAEIDNEIPAELSPARLESGPPGSRVTACPPLHIQPTSTNTSSPQYQQQTYASVLRIKLKGYIWIVNDANMPWS